MDDAAIYQASAINSKGIVSCSGVLEVGEMNEFKIHQHYFAKLKQKVQNKCRETQGKGNLEPLRTISPDRTQRKRRSTMETFVSPLSPTENEGNEEILQADGLGKECRLQNDTLEKVYNNPTLDTNETASAKTNGQITNVPGNKSKTFMYDPNYKSFTSHQPKSPFVMKKIKISDSVTHVKPEGFGGRKIMEKDTSSEATVCSKIVKNNENSEEVMEVEKNVSSLLTNTNSKNIKGECGKLDNENAVFVKSLPKDGNMFDTRTVSLQKEGSVAPSPSPSVSEKEGKKIAKHKNEDSCKENNFFGKKKNQVPHIMPAKNKSNSELRLTRIIEKDIVKTKYNQTLDAEMKSSIALDSSGFSELVDTPYDTLAVLPQYPCERTESLLSEKETSPSQKKESASQPAVPSEVS